MPPKRTRTDIENTDPADEATVDDTDGLRAPVARRSGRCPRPSAKQAQIGAYIPAISQLVSDVDVLPDQDRMEQETIQNQRKAAAIKKADAQKKAAAQKVIAVNHHFY